ncbi:MAG: ATP-dependent Clp protease ATP-binding subunit, partial [Bryobacteraceae bacterium]
RKFTPEFINRLDKIVVFKPLGDGELRKILDIELRLVQQRILMASGAYPFIFTVSPAARDFLLAEGTDIKYGARHLKRSIERNLVQPLSNLIATEQVHGGDWICVDFDAESGQLTFVKEAEGMAAYAMAELADSVAPFSAAAQAKGTPSEAIRATRAGSSRRG